MANRRMFSLDVVDTDIFLDLPISSQALYFHLGMRADDDGFVSSPKRITSMIGANQDDLKLLIAKGFVISLEGGIIVIRHWKQNNYIQADRYKKTIYQEQMALLGVSNGVYEVDTPCIQTVSKMETQDRLGKDSIDKDKKIVSNDTIRSTEVQRVVGEWNQLGINHLRGIKPETARYKMLMARINTYGTDAVIEAIHNIKESSFLQGQSKNGWVITFDWFVKPNNFIKVLEGNYNKRQKEKVVVEAPEENYYNNFQSMPEEILRKFKQIGIIGEDGEIDCSKATSEQIKILQEHGTLQGNKQYRPSRKAMNCIL